MSTPLHLEIAALARSRRDVYVEHTVRSASGPVPDGAATMGRRDLEQMIDGFLALLTEALTSDSRDVRTFFLETVVPGLIRSGTPAPPVIGGVVEFAIFISADIGSILPPEKRADASAWFAKFFNEYIADMVRVAMEASS